MANIKDITDSFARAVASVLSAANMRQYGQQAADMIRLRTQLGSSVSEDGGEKSPLKPLADSTVDRRRQLQQEGNLSENASPRKSNLTQTGQMLESIGVISSSDGEVRVGPMGTRDDGMTNDEVAGYVSDAGRPFNHLSRVEGKRISDKIRADLRDALSRLTNK